ncbi:MAG: ABC-F family ATP-binding cassette domain-containing protein [Candidatus Omnitrophota bacterium]|nr:MAG: ABC-F family ATP-binding cassette domain-containing protein [Candidatus Omnitrophota bacterium]
MITITNLSKTFGKKDLFSKFNLTINKGEKIGLVGPNGSGKSTLFYMILEKLEPSSGRIQINKGVRIGYLAQEANFTSQRKVLQEVIEGDEAIMRLNKEKEELETKGEAASARYGKILHDLEFLGYFEMEHKAKKVLSGLGFKEEEFNRPINQMSGGWQMRVLLAKLLVCHYDLLLLDEPTNFLDLGAALWLKDYLAFFKGAFVMISHDKDFLDEVTNYTLVLEHGTIEKVKGNYEHYRKIKDEKRRHLLKQFKEQEKKRQQLERFISRFHGQPNKAAQVRAKRTQLEKMAEIIVPLDRKESIREFKFPETQRSGYRVIGLEKISKSYGDIKVYKDFDFEIIKGERAVLTGPNGAGKSTLLKILAGVVDIDSGKRALGHNVEAGYFSQMRLEVLNPHHTVFEEAYGVSGGKLTGEAIRTILGMFFFVGDDVEKKVSVLSGGEKSRLILAKLLIKPPNFLLLDEPTTHLDVDAVEALIKALSDYEGTLVCISHDIHFVRSIANTVFEVNPGGRVRKFPGNFDYYLHKIKEKPGAKPALAKTKVKVSKGFKEAEKKAAPEKEEKLKEHNKKIAKRIRKLRTEKEKIEVERSVKKEILSSPGRIPSEEIAKKYRQRLTQIEKRAHQIDKEIVKLKHSFL